MPLSARSAAPAIAHDSRHVGLLVSAVGGTGFGGGTAASAVRTPPARATARGEGRAAASVRATPA
jgi:hypothetical protein